MLRPSVINGCSNHPRQASCCLPVCGPANPNTALHCPWPVFCREIALSCPPELEMITVSRDSLYAEARAQPALCGTSGHDDNPSSRAIIRSRPRSSDVGKAQQLFVPKITHSVELLITYVIKPIDNVWHMYGTESIRRRGWELPGKPILSLVAHAREQARSGWQGSHKHSKETERETSKRGRPRSRPRSRAEADQRKLFPLPHGPTAQCRLASARPAQPPGSC